MQGSGGIIFCLHSDTLGSCPWSPPTVSCVSSNMPVEENLMSRGRKMLSSARKVRSSARGFCSCGKCSGEKRPININNFSGLSRERVGVKMVNALSFPGGDRKHINKVLWRSREMPGTAPNLWIIPDNRVQMFICVCARFLIGFFRS